MARPLTVLICRAAHPDAERKPDRIHGAEIQRVPWLVAPTGRILSAWEEVDHEHGCFGALCLKCRLITEYMVVATPDMIDQEQSPPPSLRQPKHARRAAR